MKKVLKIVIPILLVLSAVGAGIFFWMRNSNSAGGEVAYGTKVSSVNYASNAGSVNRFSGVVESQQTIDFKKNSNREIEEIYVNVGDIVQKDAPLFRYDVRSSQNSIEEAYLDIEGLNSELAIYRSSNTTENQIYARQTEIAIQKKQAEIASFQQEIDNANVLATLSGIVKEVNEEGVNSDGMEAPIVRIMEIGEYRVKGKIDEQLFGIINVGDEVLVRSRVDESLSWRGKVSKIDTEPQKQEENYYGGGENTEKASSYPFYVSLDNTDGLMLGQHVLIEPSYETDISLTGIWVISDYLIEEDGTYYAYVAENNKLVKREIRVGEINEELFITEITAGLEDDDLIVWPEDGLVEGMQVINMSEARE